MSKSQEKYNINNYNLNLKSIRKKINPQKFVLLSSKEENKMLKVKKREKLEKEVNEKKLKKEEEEKKECTFKPKINKTLPTYVLNNDKHNNDNTYNYINYNKKRKSNSVEKKSFYYRNIQWLNNLNAKKTRLKQLNELKSCDFSYTPTITENYNLDEIFNNEKILKYWMKNNRTYLTRRLLTLNNFQKNLNNKIKNGINGSDIIYTERKIVKNNISSCSNVNNHPNDLNETINFLHKELQNTANDDNNNFEGKVLTYD